LISLTRNKKWHNNNSNNDERLVQKYCGDLHCVDFDSLFVSPFVRILLCARDADGVLDIGDLCADAALPGSAMGHLPGRRNDYDHVDCRGVVVSETTRAFE